MAAQVVVAVLLLPATMAASTLVSDLHRAVDFAAKKGSAGIALGICGAELSSISLAAGCVSPGVEARPLDRFAWGSVTKTFTGAAILRLVAENRLSLDSLVAPLVDPLLIDYPYSSLEKLFSVDAWSPRPGHALNASSITIRDLLSMRAGIPDYDSDGFRHLQYTLSSVDFSPLQLFDFVHGGLLFQPGTGAYNYANAYTCTSEVQARTGLFLAARGNAACK